jgi:hypothetical protein
VAHFGTNRHISAQTGTFWHKPAHFGTFWHKPAHFGTKRHKLAQNGTNWPKTAQAADNESTPTARGPYEPETATQSHRACNLIYMRVSPLVAAAWGGCLWAVTVYGAYACVICGSLLLVVRLWLVCCLASSSPAFGF